MGADYEIDSDLFFGDANSIRIKNDDVKYYRTDLVLNLGQYEMDTGYETETETDRITLIDKQYNPLDIVYIHNNDTGEVYFVSALQVKLMADREEWGYVMERIQLAVNLILVALPFGMYAWGVRGFILTLSIVEGSLALGDIVFSGMRDMISQTPGGKTFLEYWDKFYAIASITTGVLSIPDLLLSIGKFLTKGAVFLYKVTGAVRRNVLLMMRYAALKSAQLIQVIGKNFRVVINALKHREIAGFASSLTKLQKAGVVIFKVPQSGGASKGLAKYVLSYDGVPIASGRTADELKEATKSFFGKNGEVLVEGLERAAREFKVFYRNIRKKIMQPPFFKDIRTNRAYRPHEIDSFIELELRFNGTCRPSLADEAGDIIMTSGELKGKSLDPLGLDIGAIEPWKRKYTKELKNFKRSIDRHFEKIHSPKEGLSSLDKVVIDFKYMDEISPNLKRQVLEYIENPS